MTDDEGIRAINKAYRKIDKATDVLSFPMFELTAGQLPASWEAYKDPGTGLVPLGDMAISLERARQQAAEFGHSARREVGYLTIHSILHAGLRPCGRRADEKADACRRRGHSGRNRTAEMMEQNLFIRRAAVTDAGCLPSHGCGR